MRTPATRYSDTPIRGISIRPIGSPSTTSTSGSGAGAGVVGVVGLVGVVTAGAFLAYPPGVAKPLILVIEFALMPTLTLVLGLMLLGAPRRSAS